MYFVFYSKTVIWLVTVKVYQWLRKLCIKIVPGSLLSFTYRLCFNHREYSLSADRNFCCCRVSTSPLSVAYALSSLASNSSYWFFRSGDDIVRKPRLFYVSTSSTTSTVSTASICFITTSAGPVTTCSGKRRRRMVHQADSSITPSKSGDTALVSSPEDLAVDGSPKESSGREGRFLLYWITTTSTSTTTSYTTTYSISSVSCTFPGISLCGK